MSPCACISAFGDADAHSPLPPSFWPIRIRSPAATVKAKSRGASKIRTTVDPMRNRPTSLPRFSVMLVVVVNGVSGDEASTASKLRTLDGKCGRSSGNPVMPMARWSSHPVVYSVLM